MDQSSIVFISIISAAGLAALVLAGFFCGKGVEAQTAEPGNGRYGRA